MPKKREATDPALLTVVEVAQLLRITPDTVYRQAAAGALPGAVRVGRNTLRFKRRDLEAWIERGGLRLTAEEQGE